MKFLTITLIVHAPDPLTGAQVSTADRFREVLDAADDAVPARGESVAAAPAAVSPVATTG